MGIGQGESKHTGGCKGGSRTIPAIWGGTMANINENQLENNTLHWFASIGWQTAFGTEISPEGPA